MHADKNIIKDYIYLVNQLNYYARSYYLESNSLISDKDYDELYDHLCGIEKVHPEIVVPESPTQRVGYSTDRNLQKHTFPMRSSNKAYDIKALRNFVTILNRTCETKELYASYKFDGISVELIYVKGELIKATTRGDGIYGKDVLKHVLKIPNIPLRISLLKGVIIVRGEIIVLKDDFYVINDHRADNKLKKYSTIRNCASDLLLSDSTQDDEVALLRFYGWEFIAEGYDKDSYAENEIILSKLGFAIPTGKKCPDLKAVKAFIDETNYNRDKLNYDIDGVVVRVDSTVHYKNAGFTNHAPVGSIAWKFTAKAITAKILNIKWNVGRSGRLIPVAYITPVVIDNTTIEKINLGNVTHANKLQIGIGAEVEISKVDDIPKIAKVIKTGELKLPEVCPRCNGKVTKIDNDLVCTNLNCSGILEATIAITLNTLNRTSKPNSKNHIAYELVASKTVTNFIDLFKPLETKSSKITQDQLDTIVSKFRSINLSELLISIGIPGLGKAAATRLTVETGNLHELLKCLNDKTQWNYVPLSQIIKNNIQMWYEIAEHRKLLEQLSKLKLKNL